MDECLFYAAGSTPAIGYAKDFLESKGIHFTPFPRKQTTHLLLDVPSFQDNGNLRDGTPLLPLLEQLSKSITVIGGNLTNHTFVDYTLVDLLKQEDYLCKNAAITAHCALRVALGEIKSTISDSPALILGWGRIGKCLASMLKQLGTEVWLCIRNEKERAMACALGYHTISPEQDIPHPERLRILFNTVPKMILPQDRMNIYNHCIKIELASFPGIEADDIIVARGLPGKYAPESSGLLIGQCILDYLKEV